MCLALSNQSSSSRGEELQLHRSINIASQENCSEVKIQSYEDISDAIWWNKYEKGVGRKIQSLSKTLLLQTIEIALNKLTYPASSFAP